MPHNFDHIHIDLLQATDARMFLKKALEIRYKKRGRINLADFSRRAGFSSRSFMSEYLSGKKGLSRESLDKLKITLNLPKPYKDLFSLLSYKDQPELLVQKMTLEAIEKKIASIKNAILIQTEILAKIQNPDRLISSPDLFRVFAALGTEETGAKLEEITARTKMNPKTATELLQILTQEGVVIFQNDRYFSRSLQIEFLERLTPNNLTFFLKTLCMQIWNDAQCIPINPKNSFYYTAIPIQSHQIPEFNERLRDAILDVVDLYKDREGDCVHEIFFCAKS